MATDPMEALRRARGEFTRGLPDRLTKIRDALTALQQGFDGKHAEQFHVASHALTGMAATFEAHEMAECAHSLSVLGRRWRKGGAATPVEMEDARRLVGRLDAAVTAFVTGEMADSPDE